jgi:hypothetical protein
MTGIAGIGTGTGASIQSLAVPVPNTGKDNKFGLFGTGTTELPEPVKIPVSVKVLVTGTLTHEGLNQLLVLILLVKITF